MREHLSTTGNNALKDERRATSEGLEGTARRRSTILGGSRRAKGRRRLSHYNFDYRTFTAQPFDQQQQNPRPANVWELSERPM